MLMEKFFLLVTISICLFSSPWVIGILPFNLEGKIYFITFSALVIMNSYFLRRKQGHVGRVLQNFILSVIVSHSTWTLLDLIARPLTTNILYYRPHEMFINRWPQMPLVSRYTANISYRGRTYGDLAALSNHAEDRQYREIEFVTDVFGFRNRDIPTGEIDVLVLGDSFGVGNGTTQNETWPVVLAQNTQRTVYNLSIPGSPWHEYINLSIESSRLKTHPHTIILWLFFEGNDLDEDYNDSVDLSTLPWQGPIDSLWIQFQSFRRRSPTRQVMTPLFQNKSEGPVIIVKDFTDGTRILGYEPYLKNSKRTVPEIRQHPNYERMLSVIRAGKTLADRKELKLIMILVPDKTNVYSWVFDDKSPWSTPYKQTGFSSVLQDICTQEEITFIDLTPYLITESRRSYEISEELLWWRDDTHFNIRGHHVVASIIQGQIEKFLASPQ